MGSANVFFTSATRAYLPKVQVLAESLKEHNPNVVFVLALLDDDIGLPDVLVANPVIDQILSANDVLRDEPRSWVFQHSIVEACTAVKASVLSMLLAKPDVESVTYLDPDIRVFGSFDNMLALHDNASIILTPHLTDFEHTVKGILDNEVSALRHGTYNLGFISVKNDPVGRAFSDWWEFRLRNLCVDDLAGGIFTDQKWIDLVPGIFDGVAICRDPGLNLSTWNLSRRVVNQSRDGAVTVNGQPLIFAHFSGFDSGNHLTALGEFTETHPVFVDLSQAYHLRLSDLADRVGTQPPWTFASFDDGTSITESERRTYRFDTEIQTRFPSPFASGPGTFQEYISGKDKLFVDSVESSAARDKIIGIHQFLIDPKARRARVSDIYKTAELISQELDGVDGVDDMRFDLVGPVLNEHLWASEDAQRIRDVFCNGLPTVAFFGLPSGGCAAHVEVLTRLVAPVANSISFSVREGGYGSFGILEARAVSADGVASVVMPVDAAREIVPTFLRECNVQFVHVHHRFGIETLFDILREEFPGRYGITLHDYAFISPEPHLASRQGTFVGTPSVENWVELCSAGQHYPLAGDLSSPLAYERFLREAKFIIAPSNDCGHRYLQVIPDLEIWVEPHWEPVGFPSGLRVDMASNLGRTSHVPLRVVVPGEHMPTKGSAIVREVASLVARMDLDCTINVMADPIYSNPETTGRIQFRGRYNVGSLGDDIRFTDATVAWLPAQVPETYCYAASELMRNGIPIVASDIGALPERLAQYPSRVMVPWSAHPREWLEALFQAHHMPNAYEGTVQVSSGHSDFYPARYLDLILS